MYSNVFAIQCFIFILQPFIWRSGATPSLSSAKGKRVSDPSEELEERLQKEREASAEDQKWLQEASDAFIPVSSPKTPRASRLGSEETDVVVKVN